MSDTTIYDQVWAVKISEVRSFFSNLGYELNDDQYMSNGLNIIISEETSLFLCGKEMPRCRVIIKGESAIAKHVHKSFELKFLSAGG